MFEGLRKNSQSFLLIVLVASLAMLFGTQFGPGSRGCSADSLRVNYIARVYGHTIAEHDFQTMARLTNLGESRNQRLVRQAIVDGLIERELLAHEAERLGYRISDEEINQEIRDGYYYLSLGSRELPQLTGGFGPVPVSARMRTAYTRVEGRTPTDELPPFNYEDFETWVRNAFGRTVPDYKKLMAREMLAERMRNIAMVNVRVSENEVWRDYERGHNQITLRYVPFSPEFFRTVVRDDDTAAVDAFARAHQEQINQQWEQRRESFQGLPEQVRVRQILIRDPEDANDAARTATQQRAQAIRDRISRGEDFVRMARLYSQDENGWRTGGDTGWIAPDRVDAPDDVKRALANLQPGQLSQPIRSPLGVHIVQLLGRREGNIPEADAKREIAREMYRTERGNELAAEAATRAQSLLDQPGATMDSVAAQMHTEALTAFYRGAMPAPETLPGNNVLEPVSHTDVGAPELRETQPFTQAGTIPGIAESDALVRAGFQLTEQNPAPNAPVVAGNERFLIRLKEGGRQVASREEFEHDKARLMEEYSLAKRREALQQYLERLRAAAERQGSVRIGNSPLIQESPAGRAGTPEEQGAG
jgi:parvulin-like peptidyl-prolyl isomerase